MDAKRVRVRNLMTTKVETVDADATILAAVRVMRDKKVSSLVVNPADDFDSYGLVTRQDVVMALVNGRLGDLVEDIMTTPAITIAGDMSVFHCLQTMQMVGNRRLPVVEGGQLIGIISNTDIYHRMTEALP